MSYLIVFLMSLFVINQSDALDCNRGRMPENGDWVSYSIYSEKEKLELKLAIVGEEKENEKKALWFEIIARGKELDFIIKRLIVGDPLRPDKVLRQIVKIINKSRPGYSPVLEVPTGSQDKTEETLKSFPCIENVGEKIQYKFGKKSIPAFSVKSDKPKSKMIYSKEIPFFGVIKAESENTKIELIDFGRNASSEITEEPIRLIEQENLPGR